MDVYCERVGPGLLAEPLNAFSNTSFLLAALAAWMLARRTGTLSTRVTVLVALCVSVGVGSYLWHMLPNTWTFYLDVVPIVLFILWFVWLYVRDVSGRGRGPAAAGAAAFVVLTFLALLYADVLHGALVYTPGLLVVLGLGLLHASQRRVARLALLAAAVVYVAALFFRTIDNEVCSDLPTGTHFLWHLLIGLVTYLAMRPLILNLTPTAPSRRGGRRNIITA